MTSVRNNGAFQRAEGWTNWSVIGQPHRLATTSGGPVHAPPRGERARDLTHGGARAHGIDDEGHQRHAVRPTKHVSYCRFTQCGDRITHTLTVTCLTSLGQARHLSPRERRVIRGRHYRRLGAVRKLVDAH